MFSYDPSDKKDKLIVLTVRWSLNDTYVSFRLVFYMGSCDMSDMESINQKVWRALRSDPAIMRGLQRKLLNMRALAKYLIQAHELSASLDAVISSIRRFPLDSVKEESKMYRDIFRNSVISTMNNITCATIKLPAHEVVQKLGKLNGKGIRIVTGTDKVKVLVSGNTAVDLKKIFKGAHFENNLSEITVTVAEKAIKTKGVMARIAAELALANVNIHELLVCPPQFLIYVTEKDIVTAHSRILALTE